MSVLEWPELAVPSSMSWRLVGNSKTFTSIFTRSSQTVRFPGSKFACTLTFNNLNEEISRELEVLMAQLEGESGRVKITHWLRQEIGSRGNPIVSVANQAGRTLQSKGWLPNSIVIKKGNYLTINNELKMVTDNIISDANGNASIAISPMLRYSPSIGDKIEVTKPFGIFKPTTDDQGDFQYRPGILTNVNLTFEEAFY